MKHIKNFVQLTDDIATSGQPGAEQFDAIAAAGYAVVVNLAMPDSDNAIPEEGSIVTSLGMSYVHIPVPFDNPRPDHLAVFMQVMDAFAGKRRWVHCVVNYRVSAFMYHYLRTRRGFSDLQARSPVFEFWQPNETWRAFMQLNIDEVG